MKIRVGSRGSKLAIAQAQIFLESVKEKHKEFEYEIKIIKTTGDKIQDVSLDKIGDKGVFVKEIEESLIEGTIDLAVHSMKDMPSAIPEELMFSAIPKREDPRDALILNYGRKGLDELPMGAVIATGSKRREYQLLRYRPDIKIVPIRGNIDTRIRKMYEQNLDGLVIAAAGLNRLKIKSDIKQNIILLDEELMLPAPAQGALGLEIRKNDKELDDVLRLVEDYESAVQIRAEREFLKEIDGGCHLPIGALCKVEGENILLVGLLGNEDGKILVKRKIEGKAEDAEMLGIKLARIIKGEMPK
ncbi:hydroxymethylbilane synthase [Alkalibacter saccharofermentans]|uniref:Porphobilinogen deaminase n=1 Tax=Alkalibacter saccharofermentans DSM 14828 TaxID=1120975 RepID=A0A1M4SHZ5_9FIRM|nr:hydroxymethylbilane synthase [Alkalibacter saccharofermentans]SHE31831.1 hydroxymethylbilane synthase [Alkalibacter saccharofermentans DSM 14828]